MKKLYQILITACLISLLMLGTLAGAIMAQKNAQLALQNETLRLQQAVKQKEYALKTQQLKNEKLRTDIENIRFEAFMKAYSRGEYFVEVEARP